MGSKTRKSLMVLAGLGASVAVVSVFFWLLGPTWPNPVYNGKRLSYWFQQLPVAIVSPNSGGPGTVATMSGVRLTRGTNGVPAITSISAGKITWNVTKSTNSSSMSFQGVTMTSVNASNLFFAGMARNPTIEKPEDSIRAVTIIGTNAIPFLLAKLNTRESPFKLQIQKWSFKLGLRLPLAEDAAVEQGRAVTALVYLSPLPEDSLRQLRRMSTNSDAHTAALAKAVLFNRELFPKDQRNVTLFIVVPDK